MTRKRILALAVLLAFASLPGLAVATGAQEADVTISSVSVSPTNPVPGEEVTIEATVENHDSAGFFIDRVAVVEARPGDDIPEEYDDVLNIGTLSSNDSRDVELSVTFDEEGVYDLNVRVSGRPEDGSGQTDVNYPLTIDVRERQPQVDIDANDTAVGVRQRGTVTVANSLPNEIEDVELTVGGEEVAITNEREVLATLDSRESRAVTFRYRPDEAGLHTLNATLSYTTVGGRSDSVSATTTVQAGRITPQISLSANDSVAGVESSGTVTVSNALGTAIRNVEVSVGGDGVTARENRSVFTQVSDSDSVTTGFDYEVDEPGPHELNATVRYATDSGMTRTVSETVTVETEPVRDRVSLGLSSVRAADSQRLVVDLFNQGNAAVTNVTIGGHSDNATVQRALLDRVEVGESRTVRLNTTLSAESAAIDVEATYDIGDYRGNVQSETELSQAPGTISLTGVQVEPEGERIRISGSASNLGTTDAESVLVKVVDTDRVTPAEPNREFFVGPVPASDFASFDVYATISGNVSTVPLEVSYLVDGERRTRFVEVDAEETTGAGAARDEAQRQQSGGPPIVPVAVGAVVIIAVGAIMVRGWRASRGGD